MTIPARTIRETAELAAASSPADIAAILNIHQSKLPPLTGVRRHVYTTEDCYPAATGRLQAMATELLNEREVLLERILRLTAELDARPRPVYVPPADDIDLGEFEAMVEADYPERRHA